MDKSDAAARTAARREHGEVIRAELAAGSAAQRVEELLISRGVPAAVAAAIVERAVFDREVEQRLPELGPWIGDRLRHRNDQQVADELAREFDLTAQVAERLVALQQRALRSTSAVDRASGNTSRRAALESPLVLVAGLVLFLIGAGLTWWSYLNRGAGGGFVVFTGAIVLGGALTIAGLARWFDSRTPLIRRFTVAGMVIVAVVGLATAGIGFGLFSPVKPGGGKLPEMDYEEFQRTVNEADQLAAQLQHPATPAPRLPPTSDYEKVRAAFRTTLREEKPAPGTPTSLGEPPTGDSLPAAQRVTYPSGNNRLAAWITTNAEEEHGNRPAVVFAHAGTALTADEWRVVATGFSARGLVVMAPTFRGEHGNPGCFEFGFGEVDDLRAAGEWLSWRPGVNHDRVFVCGNGTGGTLALLSVLRRSAFRAGAGFQSGLHMDDADLPGWVPHSWKDGEVTMRDARDWPGCVQVEFTNWLPLNDFDGMERWGRFCDAARANCSAIPLGRYSLETAAFECAKWFADAAR